MKVDTHTSSPKLGKRYIYLLRLKYSFLPSRNPLYEDFLIADHSFVKVRTFNAGKSDYQQAILFTRRSWRPPSKGVSKKVCTTCFASSSEIKRAGSATTLALLC